MTVPLRIACSESAAMSSLNETWSLVCGCGIAAIEVCGGPENLRRRLPDLRAARRRGVAFSTLCLGPPFLGQLETHAIGGAVRSIKEAISVTADIEASGLVMPIAGPPSLGDANRELPQYALNAVAELAEHASSVDVRIYLEPLNRYEDGLVNTLQQALTLCDEIGDESLAVCGDVFHMNIEEPDVAASIHAAGARLGHVHIADSNRRQPGAGHIDFRQTLGALREEDYDGWLALECIIDRPIEPHLRDAVGLLHNAWGSDAGTGSPGSPGWRDDAPSSSPVTSGIAFTAHDGD
jgi:sugar phosphate isomerase/epimerase